MNINDLNLEQFNNIVSDSNHISREEEINKMLEESSKRLREYSKEDNSEAIASERSYRQKLFQELNNLKIERIKKDNGEKIAKLEKMLEESSKRLREYSEEDNSEAIASERSYRQGLITEISKLKSEMDINSEVGINKKVQTVNSTTLTPKEANKNNIQPISQKNNPPINNNSSSNIQRIDVEKLTQEQIKELIVLLEKRKKIIDDKIIKIDLNAPWGNTMELMGEYIIISKKINELKTKVSLKEKQEVETVLLPKKAESKEKNEKQRKPRFKRFINKIIYKGRNLLYSIRRIFRKKETEILTSDEDFDDIENQNLSTKDNNVISIKELEKVKERLGREKAGAIDANEMEKTPNIKAM